MYALQTGNEEYRSDIRHVAVGPRKDVIRAGDNVELQSQRRPVGTGRETDAGAFEIGYQIQTKSGKYYLLELNR